MVDLPVKVGDDIYCIEILYKRFKFEPDISFRIYKCKSIIFKYPYESFYIRIDNGKYYSSSKFNKTWFVDKELLKQRCHELMDFNYEDYKTVDIPLADNNDIDLNMISNDGVYMKEIDTWWSVERNEVLFSYKYYKLGTILLIGPGYITVEPTNYMKYELIKHYMDKGYKIFVEKYDTKITGEVFVLAENDDYIKCRTPSYYNK